VTVAGIASSLPFAVRLAGPVAITPAVRVRARRIIISAGIAPIAVVIAIVISGIVTRIIAVVPAGAD
jgi:hypothetical protein